MEFNEIGACGNEVFFSNTRPHGKEVLFALRYASAVAAAVARHETNQTFRM